MAAAPPRRLDLLGPAPPLGTLYIVGGGRAAAPFPWRNPSLVLGKALPENRKLHHHAIVLPKLSLNFSSPLLDQ